MNITLHDTIAAIASAPEPAQRGIIRVTGQDTRLSIQSLLAKSDEARDRVAQARGAVRLDVRLQLPVLHSSLSAALMWWPTEKSFTGQPMAEIHMLGSPPLLDAVLERLFELDVRAANRGEFTLRAFLTGRIDLVQAEAVLGVIDAADHEELETALTQLGGAVTSSLRAVRDSILCLLGDLEAGLDFVEEDIEFVSKTDLSNRLQHCLILLAELDDQSKHRLPSGRKPRVTLAGLPNAGKSTLFNALAGESKAIVSDIAGTTRDYLLATIDIGNLEVDLVDTAGWESADDIIMQQAQELRGSTMQESDLVVWCQAADLNEVDQFSNHSLCQQLADDSVPILHVVTRNDLAGGAAGSGDVAVRDCAEESVLGKVIKISFPDGGEFSPNDSDVAKRSVRQTMNAISSALLQDRSSKGELLGSTAVRCRDSLRRTIISLQSARAAADSDAGDEIISMELRDALQQLSTILGEVYTDDILDHIFSNFCIGK